MEDKGELRNVSKQSIEDASSQINTRKWGFSLNRLRNSVKARGLGGRRKGRLREAGGGGSRGLRCMVANKAVCSDPKDITWQTLGRGAGSPAVGLGGTAGKPWVSQNQVNQHGLRP